VEILGVAMGLLRMLVGQVVIDAGPRVVPHLVLLGIALLVGTLPWSVAVVLVHVALVAASPLVGAVTNLILDVGPAVDAVVLCKLLALIVPVATVTSLVVVASSLDTIVDSGGGVVHHAVGKGGGRSGETICRRGVVWVLVLICCGLVVAHDL